MELRHLEYFVAVAEERHFTRAAERMRVAQSGLSAAIRSLERDLDAELFVRSTRRVELTDAGRALLVEAHRTLASAVAARDAVAAVRGLLRGSLAVGSEQCLGVIDLPPMLASFRRAHPGVEIQLRYAGSGQVTEQIRQGRLNVGFVALPGPPPDGVRLLPLAAEEMVLLCHPGHRLAGRETVDVEALLGEDFVDFSSDWGARRVNDQTFARAEAERRVSVEVNDVHTLLDFVHQGLGVALVPAPVTRKPHAKGLHAATLAAGAGPTWQVSVAVAAGAPPGPATAELLRMALPGATHGAGRDA
ncbi:LysR family transcriptional regulator [Micromonospora sp. WMMD812]|uniref:LysR family transcriptional regulator n=1 Tax=Micromonospora sp. WMMD812 TaxID=3015152 RepID=UPI00248C7D43|nr:LysR family transcriptional regulator [Micromonospora sp. WMMD812]WBB66110.1 LysR family transcriptional regulator [Micromonospora sp. WMMD812]